MFLQKLSDIPCHVWIFIRVHQCSNWTKWWTKHVPRNMEIWMVFPKKGYPQISTVLFCLYWNHGFRVPSILKDPPYLVDYWNPSPLMFHSTFHMYRIQTAMTTDSEIPTCYFHATFLFLLSELHTVLPWFSVKYPLPTRIFITWHSCRFQSLLDTTEFFVCRT